MNAHIRRNKLNGLLPASEFKGLTGIEYFDFEEDFMEDGVRCIPMIVRFKMDAAGIKLKLAEWAKFTVPEKKQLALQPCHSAKEIFTYKTSLQQLVRLYSGNEAGVLTIDKQPAWADLANISPALCAKANSFGWEISLHQWAHLSNLQRFVLLKLCRPGHEDRNFPKAMKEFKLVEEAMAC